MKLAVNTGGSAGGNGGDGSLATGGTSVDACASWRIRDEQDIEGQSGAVSVVQRVSSDLRINPYLHAIVVDGVFSANSDSVFFHPLARLDDSDVADLLQVIRVRVVLWNAASAHAS